MGLTHRFAGSGDRAAIAGLVYDALRRRASSAYLMGDDSPRAILLGMLKRERGLDAEAIGNLANGVGHAPSPLTEEERERLDAAKFDDAPPHVTGDYPEWLDPHLACVFGDDRAEEGAALASRAPLDLRVNTLAAERDKAAAMLADLKPEAARGRLGVCASAFARRRKKPGDPRRAGLPQGHDRNAGRRFATCRAVLGAKPGEQVVDLCAGAGGKTLALAAMMENKGQIYATDDDKRRLAPIHERFARSGARNVQVRTPKSVGDAIADLDGRMRPGADRRALHRHRRLAAQSGRQMAHAPRRAGAAQVKSRPRC